MQDALASKYPILWATLMAVRSEQPALAPGSRAEVNAELSLACEETCSFLELLSDTFGEPQPTDAFVCLSLNIYHQLGFSEESQKFLGGLWADAAMRWDGNGRAVFLSLLLRDRHEVFETLDIAVELFRGLQFSADEVFPWIEDAHRRVANDMYQKGFWGCAEAFCRRSPDAATLVCERWLATRPPTPSLNVISNMIGWLRVAGHTAGTRSESFLRLEDSVKAGGCPAWRALFIQSWTHGSGRSPITEEEALHLRDHYVVPDSNEETAWCLLLNSVVHIDRAAWHWAHRELMSMARPALSQDSKHWIAVAALHGIEHAQETDAVSAEHWRDIFRLLLPLSVGAPLWRAVHGSLTSLASKNGVEMRELVRLLAAQSAQSWLEELRGRDFRRFFQVVKEKTPASVIATELCLGAGAGIRQVGLLFFDECRLERLDPNAVQNATPVQIELLLLEAQRRHISYGALARLHASLPDRVDEIQGHLPELFYDEVALQCMNTNEYRAALVGARPEHEYLQAIAVDARERLAAISSASRSPAFRMQAPGQMRAQILHDRRFVREVSAGVEQHSTFLSLFSSVHLLYGGTEPRIFLREGELSPPVQMRSSSSSVEVPRLEFIDPEGMTLRRLSAAARAKMLEEETDSEVDDK
jgi:hypothetical protein